MKVPAQDNTVVRFEIAPRSIAWILGTIVGVWLFLQLWAIALLEQDDQLLAKAWGVAHDLSELLNERRDGQEDQQ